MKKQLLAGLMLAGMSVFAQTPRLSLFEEFTGETCPPCASTNPGLNLILANPTNTALVVAIKWQVPIPSAPSNTWSLYQTNKIEIDWRYKATGTGYGYPSQWTSTTAVTSGINAAPTGLFDGQHQWLFGAASDHPAYVTNAVIAAAQSYTSAFSVTMARAWDATFSSVNLTVSILATASFSANGPLVFRTVMVEKAIHFATQPGTNGEKDFEDAAIASFPSIQTGVAMAGTWTIGQVQTFTLNCPIPAYARDKAQIAFVGFIQDDGNRKVAQAVRSNPQSLPNDAKAIYAKVTAFSCGTSFTPEVSFSNNGNNAITALTLTPYVDGIAAPNYTWSGSLAVGASSTVNLNPITPTLPGGHLFSYNIVSVSGGDVNGLNNSANTSFYLASSYPVGSPVVQPFATATFPPTAWGINNANAGASWSRNATANGISLTSGTGAAKYDFYSNSVIGDADDLILPPIGFTATSAPTLSFDVAYAQYQTENDQLDVSVSTDCGASWTNVYSKAGSALSTAAAVTAAFVPTSASQWRKEVVTLTGYQNSNVIVKFTATSAFGNNMYIDNVNLSQPLCTTQSISINAPKTVICKGDALTITASGAATYSWSNNQTGSSIVVTPNATTSYTAVSTEINSCHNSSALTVSVNACSGISGVGMEMGSVSVFPNPSSGLTNLTINLIQNENVSVSVMNNVGELVFDSPAKSMEAGVNSLVLNTENWASGVYFIKVSSQHGTVNQKLTVSK